MTAPLAKGAVVIDYTNYRGERRERLVLPVDITFRVTPHHTPAQWVMNALDYGKGGARRTYAMKDIHSWRPATDADARLCGPLPEAP